MAKKKEGILGQQAGWPEVDILGSFIFCLFSSLPTGSPCSGGRRKTILVIYLTPCRCLKKLFFSSPMIGPPWTSQAGTPLDTKEEGSSLMNIWCSFWLLATVQCVCKWDRESLLTIWLRKKIKRSMAAKRKMSTLWRAWCVSISWVSFYFLSIFFGQSRLIVLL